MVQHSGYVLEGIQSGPLLLVPRLSGKDVLGAKRPLTP